MTHKPKLVCSGPSSWFCGVCIVFLISDPLHVLIMGEGLPIWIYPAPKRSAGDSSM